jgi:hypothetical protein
MDRQMLRMRSSLAQTQAEHRALEQSEKTARSELQGAQRKAQQYRQENQTLMSNYDRWVHNLVHASTAEASGSAPPPPPPPPLRRAALAVDYSADVSSALSSPVSPASATTSRAAGGYDSYRCRPTSSRPYAVSSGSSQ